MDRALGVASKASYPRFPRFPPMLSPSNFVVFHFPFGLVVRFGCIFVTSTRAVSRAIFLHVDVQWLQHRLLKGLSLPFCIVALYSFVQDQLTVFMQVRFWALHYFPLLYLSVLSPISHTGKALSFSLLSMMFAVGILYIVFIKLRKLLLFVVY